MTKAEAVIAFEQAHASAASGFGAALPSAPVAGPGAVAPGARVAHNRADFVDMTQGMDWVPVLIDFGCTKVLPTGVRLGLAKMVVSAELLDYGGLLDSHMVRVP